MSALYAALRAFWHAASDPYVEKACPNCGYTLRQVPHKRSWHWCEDGDKYELRAECAE